MKNKTTISDWLKGIGIPAAIIIPLLLFGFAAENLKFAFLIHRIKSADSPEEEKRAFQLAADWGRLWEVGQVDRKEFPKGGEEIDSRHLIRIEWMEGSPYFGSPPAVFHAVIDTNNLPILYKKYHPVRDLLGR